MINKKCLKLKKVNYETITKTCHQLPKMTGLLLFGQSPIAVINVDELVCQ